MSLDIRLPIGLFFALVGLIVAVFGLVSDRSIYERSQGINVNLIWGCVLVAFGAVMLTLAWQARRRGKQP